MLSRFRKAVSRWIGRIFKPSAYRATTARPPKKDEIRVVLYGKVTLDRTGQWGLPDIHMQMDAGQTLMRYDDAILAAILSGAPVALSSAATVKYIKDIEAAYGTRVFDAVLKEMGKSYAE